MKIDNNGYESDLEDELIEMHVDFEAKALFKRKNLTEQHSKCLVSDRVNSSGSHSDRARRPMHSRSSD